MKAAVNFDFSTHVVSQLRPDLDHAPDAPGWDGVPVQAIAQVETRATVTLEGDLIPLSEIDKGKTARQETLNRMNSKLGADVGAHLSAFKRDVEFLLPLLVGTYFGGEYSKDSLGMLTHHEWGTERFPVEWRHAVDGWCFRGVDRIYRHIVEAAGRSTASVILAEAARVQADLDDLHGSPAAFTRQRTLFWEFVRFVAVLGLPLNELQHVPLLSSLEVRVFGAAPVKTETGK